MKTAFTQLITILLIAITFQVQAQPSWQWGKRGGSGGSGSGFLADERVIDMATDRNGNVYVLAVNNVGRANVDGNAGVSVRDRLTIASWGCRGNFRWMKNIGGASLTIGRALATDTLDGVYVTGQTISNNALGYTYFDTDSNLGNTNKKLFIVKYDTIGRLKWLKMPQADTVDITSPSRPLDLVTAPNGDIFWYAWLGPGNYDNNRFIVTTAGYYIVRFNAAGVYQNIVPLAITTTGGGDPANANGITIAEFSRLSRDANSGRFYLTGQYDKTFGTLTFGTTPVNSTGAPGALPIYLAAFNSSGNALWSKQSEASQYASTRECRPAIGPQGHVYIAGDIATGNTFGGHTFINNVSIHTFPFALAVDSNGNNVWATSGLPKDGGFPINAIAYTNNTIGLAGHYGGFFKWGNDSIVAPLTMSGTAYILLVRLNATTGSVIGMDSIASQSTLNNYASAITGDKRGNFYVGGSFDYRLFPARDTIAIVGGTYDWFVAKFGSAQCNCTVPVANFNAVNGSGNLVNFTYTGTTPIDSVVWDFGNGRQATGTNTSHNFTAAGSRTVCATTYSNCGSNTYCRAVTTSGTSVGNVNSSSRISLYPNPATGSINIEHDRRELLLELSDIFGRRVLATRLTSHKERVDISGLVNGIYLVRFTDENGHQHILKFIKE